MIRCEPNGACECELRSDQESSAPGVMYVLTVGGLVREPTIANRTDCDVCFLVADEVKQAHLGKVCSTCQQQLVYLDAGPEVLIVDVPRSEFKNANTTVKLHTSVKVNSHLVVPVQNGIRRYQIVAVTCHEGQSVSNGHYVSYIRIGETWWLFNDSQVTEIEDIGTSVNSQEVSMCYYVPVENVHVSPLPEVRIGAVPVRGTRNRNVVEPEGSSSKRPKL